MEELHDPPAEAYDDDEFVEAPLSGLRAELVSSIVDQVAAVERNQAKLKAWQVEMIDDARLLAEATERGVLTVGSTLSASQRQEMVRRSLVAELACALRMPETTVIRMVTDSEALIHRLPGTMTALRAGEISYRHAQVLVDQTNTLPADAALVVEEQALPHARTLTVSKFTAKARQLREHLDPESITTRVQKSVADRRLEFQPAPDGMAWLNLYTTAPAATSIFTAVRDQALALRSPADPRTLTQLTADVCADALSAALSGDLPTRSTAPTGIASPTGTGVVAPSTTGATAAGAGGAAGPCGGGTAGPGAGFTSSPSTSTAISGFGADPTSAFRRIRPTVTVTVPALTLLGWGNEPATLDGYGPIDPDTARLLAGQSSTWFRMLTDPKTGAPLSLDSTRTYRPSKAMKRYLAYRDGTCRFPGCNRAARHCDIDHTEAYAFGGPTECENLSHLCPKHHRLKHHTTWQAKQIGNGTLRWTSPGGQTYATKPVILLTDPDPPPQATTASTDPPTLLSRPARPTDPTQSQPRIALPASQSPKALPSDPTRSQPPKALPSPPPDLQPPKALPPRNSDDPPPF